MKTFYISDLHLYHKNVIKMCSRPYEDLEEMNADFIHKWNSVVTHEDKVMILGDVGFPRNQE
ncbi:hypothetical protein [Romboutsia sp.]|uniref:hypothetical protein n=1 Tax=Romboutsia sp. TaxID=1965302 RepID=UPI003F31AC22